MSARVDIIRAWATRLGDLQPRTAHPDDASLLGIMAGALYSLEQADQLGYQDARGTAPNLDVLANEFRTTLRKIGKGDQPPQTWHGRVGRWRGGATSERSPAASSHDVCCRVPARQSCAGRTCSISARSLESERDQPDCKGDHGRKLIAAV